MGQGCGCKEDKTGQASADDAIADASVQKADDPIKLLENEIEGDSTQKGEMGRKRTASKETAEQAAGAVPAQAAELTVEQQIEKAVADKDAEKISSFVEKEQEMMSKKLHEAYRSSDMDLVTLLHKCGVDIESKDSEGNTLLLLAAGSGQSETVKSLLDLSADKEAKGNDGFTALALAVARGHNDVAKILTEAGANRDVPADADGHSILMVSLTRPSLTMATLFDAASLTDAETEIASQQLVEACKKKDWDRALKLIGIAHLNPRESKVLTERLVDACNKKDWAAAKELIRLSDTAPAESSTLSQCLLETCSKNKWVEAKALINLGAVSVAPQKGDSSALSIACDKGKGALAAMMLKTASKEEVAALNKKLFEALTKSKVDPVKNILECKVSVDVKDKHGQTPLLLAVSHGSIPIMKLLLEKGAKKDVQTKDKKVPFEIAVDKGNTEAVDLLVQHGAQIPAAYPSIKMCIDAANAGETAKVAIQIACGVDLERKDGASENALHKAAKMGHAKVVELLLEKKAKVDAKGSDFDCTAIYLAAKENKLDVFKALLEGGADKQTIQKDRRPLIGQAVRTNNKDMVKLLIQGKVDLNGGDVDNDTALHIGAMNGCYDSCKLLMEAKADHTIKNNKDKTPLMVARGSGDWKAIFK